MSPIAVNDMRHALLFCIDELLDIADRYERRVIEVDEDEARSVRGAIAYVRNRKAPYAYNGPLQPTVKAAK